MSLGYSFRFRLLVLLTGCTYGLGLGEVEINNSLECLETKVFDS